MKMKSEYEIYRSQTDPFWSDIPHEKSTMASKKRKVKRNALYLMKARPSLRDVNISPPARKKRMKTFIRHKKCLLKEDFRVVLPLGHVEDEISATTSHERISLFVKSRTTYRIFLHGKLNMIQLKEAIEYKDNIPAHLQMLTHHGKLIRPSTLKNLQPDDTIHVIVRSKGGMKGAATKLSVVKKGAGLPNSATEDEVQEWLLSVIKVPRLLIKDEVKFVDGEVLNEYTKASDIKEELGLPMGFCRKILYLNENHTGDMIYGMSKESLESFTPYHICGVAKETFKDNKHLDQILQAIRNEHIDGFVAMLYENPETLATDLNIKKVLGRKLLICIKRALKEFSKDILGTKNVKGRTDIETEIKTAPEHDISTEPTAQLVSKTASEHTSELSPGAPKKPGDASQHLESPSITFLRKHLGLDIEQTNDVRQKSDHQLLAIHSSWEPSHQLARMFLFWVLCKGDQFDKSCDRKELWKVIVQSTSTWLQTLPEVLQSDFVEGKGENQFQFKGQKSVRLCPVGEKVIKYEHLTPKQRDQYKYHILILHEDIIDTKDQVYKIFDGRCCLTASVKEVTNKMYCIDKTITNVKTLTLNTPTKSLSHTQKSREAFSEGGENDNEFDLTYHGEMKERYRKTHTFSQKPTMNDLKTDIQFQRPRPFKQDCLSTVYFKDYVIDIPECGSGMITPSIEFKYFCSSLDTVNQNSPIEKFLTETLRFACGCLNRRRNGTIYFGIADDKPVDGIKRRHGQVVGFPIMEVDMDSKTKYADALNEAKSKCFDSPEANMAAKECIKTPVFVKVAPSSEQVPLFVMEVDIEPYSSFCEGIKFKLDLSKICKKKPRPFLFVRDDAETRKIESKEEELHFVHTLSTWDQKRKVEENSVSRQFSTENDHKYLAEKLCNKLCRHSNHFNLSLWPILVSSKPSDELKENLLKALSFISNIHWSAVFEFDDESSSNGLCKHFFSTPQTTLTSGEIFRDVENNNDLRDQLKLPENNVFIYCNGRSELRKPHLRKRDWKKQYSPNVKAAINFFQQRSVIPLGRTIILFLLQGNDFDGFLHIFGEMITFFGSEEIIMLCEDRNIFKSFKEQALLQDIVDLEELERNCIVGMTWEQTNDTINALLGVEKQSVTSIPTSTGGAVDVELKVQESWNTLQILSYNQCEDRQFETPLDKQQFGKEKELKFYQGNRVEWWNFFFEGHVMTRHCFRNLRNKVHDALTGQKSDKTKVVPIILNHEPGAGGSTLVRHILWEFHKDFRCAVLTKLLEKTAGDILSFWRYKEKDIRYAQPVLLVIDSVIEYKLDLDELHRLVTTESWKMESNTKKPVCVFLICKREESINSFPRTRHQDISAFVYLPQKVEKTEKEWLTNKIQQLEDTSRDLGLTHFKGEYFISFMILHSNFEQEFLQETIKNLLKDMDVEHRLFKLLMYVALVIRFVSPPKGGAAIAIPVECCSEHMGLHSRIDTGLQKNSLWENNLDGPLKVLLLIEMKEYGSGKQIRMAHPNLARAVIGCIQTKYLYCELSSIAMDFLRSDLLKTTSYGKKFLNQLTVEMLTRRKKEEYNDDENTFFSPLIASILSESGQCKPAANVLGKGFELLKDSSIAHQLARLHVHYKEYDLAKEWAKQAVELSPRRSIFLHTYGNVFKQDFLNLKIWDSKKPVNPADEATTDALDLALEALRHFQNACTCEKFEKNLLAHHDTLSTVLCIARFINEIVGIRRDELSNYFTEDVVPEAVVCWENYHSKLKMLFSIGFEAVEELDEHIYYKQCSYASKYNQQNDEHRISRFIKGKLPDMFEDFINFFCPRTDSNDPPPYVKSDELRDGWHRRCIVSLGGKRLVDIFRITLSDTKDAATQLLYTVRRHLKEIKEASADDYLTLVAVNLALAQMRAAKQNSMTDLYGYCKQIILAERKRNLIHMAYMYIVMLQWPRKTQEIQYDHDLMKKAMRYLFDESRAKKHQKLKAENEFFKRENNIYHSVTLFFLGKERGLSRFIYHSHLFGKRKQKDIREEVWERHDIKERLQLVYGYTKIRHNSCAISIVADMEQYGLDNEIEVRNLKCRPLELSERPVLFYLGFSLSGPVVCYVCPTETALGGLRFAVDNIEYSQLTKAELLNLQREIEQLKTKARLNEKEEVLIRDEREIAEALWRFESDKTIFD